MDRIKRRVQFNGQNKEKNKVLWKEYREKYGSMDRIKRRIWFYGQNKKKNTVLLIE